MILGTVTGEQHHSVVAPLSAESDWTSLPIQGA